MSDIKWQSPPPKRHAGGAQGTWPDLFAALRERPGEWALVAESAYSSVSSNIKNGRYKGGAIGEFESVSRKREDGKYDIYARYVGEVSA